MAHLILLRQRRANVTMERLQFVHRVDRRSVNGKGLQRPNAGREIADAGLEVAEAHTSLLLRPIAHFRKRCLRRIDSGSL